MGKTTTTSKRTDADHTSGQLELLARWLAEAGQVDVIEQRSMTMNRVFAPTKVRDHDALVRFAVENSQKTGRRTIVVLGPLGLALVENGKVIGICTNGMETFAR